MVFSSVIFLFFFLPLVLALYFAVPFKFKNTILLIFSLVFYAWGEPRYVVLMIVSILMNYGFGLWVDRAEHDNKKKRIAVLTSAIIINIGLLGFFKYANFFVDVMNAALHTNVHLEPVPLPIGISFYTFHALSYLIDVYRNKEKAQRNLFRLALYITFFPQLVAGPIIRYNAVAEQLRKRVFSSIQFAEGIKRFILGLSKKILLANPLGLAADTVFATSTMDLSTGSAWIGILAYTLQIYFDFSGYSDMAIGLAKMFGFEFAENFNYPYISKSISEFWRRWHISLGSWFRDYVYIPLGGSRVTPWKIYRNLFIVWALTGFWHGASWTFIAWGLYYGILIALEKAGLERLLARIYPLNHVIVLLLVMIGWVFFRADNFGYAASYIHTMFATRGLELFDSQALSLLSLNWFYFAIAIVVATPVFPKLRKLTFSKSIMGFRNIGALLFYFFLFAEVILYLINSTYNPFLYFRF
ncbi:MBOAT family O-acyltransferase [Paenibacillus radicis (ex Gao et al. 2016)]|uniref:Alginate regulatory protein n=1 Tax=Paenibacillus radicis (ex Gao et al. 2016) TaxID=1737354 RepID=A0A917H633_9BACL|nr:MBOAT family protein [Paenibacillus radicis (ex Gao et al. 2016)]GGG68795.1 alginate regulatory protein [Paenibacillus radicis (ex Gao et al. 2016)]